MEKPLIPPKEQSLYKETAKLRVLEVLFLHPEKEFSMTDMAKEAKVAKANIGKILEELRSKGFIGITKLNVMWRIKSNQQNKGFARSKIIYNLNLIHQSGLADFLADFFKNPKSIILFGSFRKGEDISNSDIDIAIEAEDAKEYRIMHLKELAGLEGKIRRKIQIHLFNRKNIDAGLFNNIANGIVLSGFLEVRQ